MGHDKRPGTRATVARGPAVVDAARRPTRLAIRLVIIGLAAAVYVMAQPTVTNAATPPDSRSSVADSVKQSARQFLRVSQCPIQFVNARPVGEVTRANAAKTARRVVRNTWVPTGSNGECAAVVPKPRDPAAVARHRSAVRAMIAAGDTLVRIRWRNLANRKGFTTLGVTRPRGNLRFEPVMGLYARPVPASTPEPPVTARSAVGKRIPAAQVVVGWQPWRAKGSVCLAKNGYGKCVVRKKVTLRITVSEGLITDAYDSINVEAAWGHRVEHQVTKRFVDRDGQHCWEVTVDPSWNDILGKITGTNQQIYTLCAEGTGNYESK